MGNSGSKIYFGWYIVITASIIVLISFGLRMGIGPFVDPIITDLGFSRTEISTVISVGMLIYGLGMPLAGYLITKYSTRIVLIVGMIISCGSIYWSIHAVTMTAFLFSYGILLSLGLSFLSNITLTPILCKWFVHRRGRALFYLAAGSMAGIAIITPVETLLIASMGWKNTLLLFSAVIICIVLPAAIFLMRENVPEGADKQFKGKAVKNEYEQPNLKISDALKTKAYWQVTAGLFVCGYGMNLMGSHAVPMLVDHHFETITASFAVGMIGVVAIISTFFMGAISDRYPRKYFLFCVYMVRGTGILLLVLVTTPWQLYLVAITGGLVWSGSIAMSSAILSELYGVRLLGFLNGWAYFGHQIGGALGSFLGGWGYETFGTHYFAFGLTGVLSLIASWLSLRLPEKIDFQPTPVDYKHTQTG